VDPFHQNIPAYMQSVVSEQLQGRWGSNASIDKHCPEGTRSDATGRTIFPCGLRATSVFNDTFEVFAQPGTEVLPSDRSGIAWKSDVTRYRNPDGYPDVPNVSWLFMRYPASTIPKEEGARSEAFAVWMRPKAMPLVLNPYGRVEEGLFAGQNITIRINASFPVRSVGAKKYLVLRTASYLGSASDEFTAFYFLTGSICWACSGVVLVIRACCARDRGQPRRSFFARRVVSDMEQGNAKFRWSLAPTASSIWVFGSGRRGRGHVRCSNRGTSDSTSSTEGSSSSSSSDSESSSHTIGP